MNIIALGQHISKTKPQTSPLYGNGDGYGFGHVDGYGDEYGSTNNHYQGMYKVVTYYNLF